jgi:MFS family permease
MTEGAGRTLRESMRVLRPGPFRRYMMGESLSTTGTWMQMMAEAWVMTSLTASAFVMGLVTFATGIPVLLLTMAGGATADRFSKRRIILVCQVAQITLASTMGMLVYTQAVQIWHVIAIAAALGVVTAFEMPAVSALVPELVEKDEIADAMAVDRSTFHTTRLVGPAFAGLVIGTWGPSVAFFANALSFVPLMIALKTIPEPVRREEPEHEADAGDDGGIKAGLAYARRDPPTAAMIGIMALLTLFPMPVLLTLLPLYARQLGLDALGMGFLMSVNAGGALLGSILLLRVPRPKRPRAIAGAALVVGVGLVGLALASWAPVAALVLFALSVGLATTFGLVNTTVQERVPDRLRGRVSALSQLTFFGMQPFASLGMAALADVIGLKTTFMAAGPLYAAGVLLLLFGPGRREAAEGAPLTT